MIKRAFTPGQIINNLREVEILLSQGATTGEASRKVGITEQTYYRWRREYGGMRVELAIREFIASRIAANLSPASYFLGYQLTGDIVLAYNCNQVQ